MTNNIKHIPNNYKNIFTLLIFLAITLIIYYPNAGWLWHVWKKDPNFSHGMLIPILSGYILFKEYPRIKAAQILSPNWIISLLIIGTGALIQTCAIVFKVNTVSTYSFVIILFGIIYMVYGKNIASILRFPICFLFLMVPISSVIIDPFTIKLKYFATTIAAEMLRLLSFPVFREGVVIHMPKATLEVVDACSGLRSLISLMTISLFLSYLVKSTKINRILIFISAVPVAIVVNILRIFILAIMSELYDPQISRNEFVHNASGIIVFFAGIIILTLIGNKLNSREARINNENK